MRNKENKSFDNDQTYASLSKIFHWSRLLLLILIYLGAFTDIMDHRVLGTIFFFFISLNIVWKLMNKVPKSYAATHIEANIEHLIHIFIYMLMFIIPIFGYLSIGRPYSFYGLFNIQPIYNIEIVSTYIKNWGMEVYMFRNLINSVHVFLTTFILSALVFLHIFMIIVGRIMRKTKEIERITWVKDKQY